MRSMVRQVRFQAAQAYPLTQQRMEDTKSLGKGTNVLQPNVVSETRSRFERTTGVATPVVRADGVVVVAVEPPLMPHANADRVTAGQVGLSSMLPAMKSKWKNLSKSMRNIDMEFPFALQSGSVSLDSNIRIFFSQRRFQRSLRIFSSFFLPFLDGPDRWSLVLLLEFMASVICCGSR